MRQKKIQRVSALNIGFQQQQQQQLYSPLHLTEIKLT